MSDSIVIPDSDSSDLDYSILNFLENHSRRFLNKLKSKTITPTSSKSLNELLNGGIRSQEITEIFGEDFRACGDFLTNLAFECLQADKHSEAIIITTSFSQNEHNFYEICRSFYNKSKEKKHLNDFIASFLKRIYIVPCLSSRDLSNVIDMILEKKYTKNSKYHLGIVTLHIFSSLFQDLDPRGMKNDSSILSFKLRSLAIEMNCAIFLSNHQTQLSVSNSKFSDFQPFLESDNPVFSKLSKRWHSIVDTRILLEVLNMEHIIKFRARIIKSRRSPYKVSTVTICKTGKTNKKTDEVAN